MTALSKDLQEFIRWLEAESVEYLIVGAWAVAFHGRPRYRVDLDIFLRRDPANADRTNDQDLRHAPNRATQGQVHVANTVARFLCILVFLLSQPATLNPQPSASAMPAVVLECGGLTPLWISGSSGFGFFSTLTPAMESAVKPAHSKGL